MILQGPHAPEIQDRFKLRSVVGTSSHGSWLRSLDTLSRASVDNVVIAGVWRHPRRGPIREGVHSISKRYE
jgi:hypothetical protein